MRTFLKIFFALLPALALGQIPTKYNLKGWVRADSMGKTYSADGQIDSVKNLGSIGGWFVQGTAGNRPLYRTNVVNSKPGIDFDGTDDNLAMPSSTALWNFLHNSTDQTVFTVFLLDGINETQAIVQNNSGTSAQRGYYSGLPSTNTFQEFITTGTAGSPVINAQSSFARYSTGVVYFATTTFAESATPDYKMWINQRLLAEYDLRFAASASNATNNLALGSSTVALNGKLLEWIAYSDLKNADSLALIENYIINKYGVTASFSGNQPDHHSNLCLWLRADSLGKNYSANAEVDSIRNWGTRGGWFNQGTSANRPLYRTSVSTNGKPGVDFDGDNDNLTQASSTATYNFFHRSDNQSNNGDPVGDEFTAFVVFSLDASGRSIFLHNNNNTATNQGVLLEVTDSNNIRTYITNGSVGQKTFEVTTSGTYGTTGVVQYFWTSREEDGSDTCFVKVNNTEFVNAILANSYTNSSALINMTLGHTSSSLDGKLLELFAYDDRKSPNELATLTTYIQNKYGLSAQAPRRRRFIPIIGGLEKYLLLLAAATALVLGQKSKK